jgi:hypothetical protein
VCSVHFPRLFRSKINPFDDVFSNTIIYHVTLINSVRNCEDWGSRFPRNTNIFYQTARLQVPEDRNIFITTSRIKNLTSLPFFYICTLTWNFKYQISRIFYFPNFSEIGGHYSYTGFLRNRRILTRLLVVSKAKERQDFQVLHTYQQSLSFRIKWKLCTDYINTYTI